ncbi:MAG: type II toxin-antitoxin system HicA family toxin [Chlamydiota bacterium]|nr:type II toxin-antitoxin system HicA family toxin [Chlamydiota bacterium]
MVNFNTNINTLKKYELGTNTHTNSTLIPSHIHKNVLNSDEQKSKGTKSIEKKNIKPLNKTYPTPQPDVLNLAEAFKAVIQKNYYPRKHLGYNLFPYVLDIIYEIKSNITHDDNRTKKLELIEVFFKSTLIGLDILKAMTNTSSKNVKDSDLCGFVNSTYLQLIECIDTYSNQFNRKNRLELDKLKEIIYHVSSLVKSKKISLQEFKKNLHTINRARQDSHMDPVIESFNKIRESTALLKKAASCFTDFIISEDYLEVIENDPNIAKDISLKALKTNYEKTINLIDKKVKQRIKQSINNNYDHISLQNLLNYIIITTKDVSVYFSKIENIAESKKTPRLFRVAKVDQQTYKHATKLCVVVNYETIKIDSITSSVLKTIEMSFLEFENQVCNSFSLAAITNGKVLDINAAYKLIESFSSLQKTLNTYITETIPGLAGLLVLIFDYVNDLNKLLDKAKENSMLIGKFYFITRQTTVILEGIEESIIPNALRYLNEFLSLTSPNESKSKKIRITLSRIDGVIKLLDLFEQHARPLFNIVENFSETMLIDKKVNVPEKIIVIDETAKETSTLPESVIQKDIEAKLEEPEITITDEKFLDEVDLQELDSNLNEKEYIKKIEETVVEIENYSANQPTFIKNMKLRKLLKIVQAHGYKLNKKRGKGSHIQGTKPGFPTLTITGHKMVSPGVTEQNLKVLENLESTHEKATEDLELVDSPKNPRTKKQQKKRKAKKNRPKRR